MRQEEYYDSDWNLVKADTVLKTSSKKFRNIQTDEQKRLLKELYERIAVDGRAQNIGEWNSSIFGTHQMEDGKKGGRKPKDPNKPNPKKENSGKFKDDCKEHKVFPLFSPLLTQSLTQPSRDKKSKKYKLSFWDKAAMRVAAAHLISWNDANKRTKESYGRQNDEITTQKIKYDKFGENLKFKIEQYCEERKDTNAGFETKEKFYITDAMCGGLFEIIKKWKGKSCTDEKSRKRILTEWQSDERLKHKIGDVNFFNWLLKEDNKCIWEEEDFIKTIKGYHAALKKYARMRNGARYTLPDKINSPRWLMYEYNGGSNLKKYEVQADKKKLKLKLPLLKINSNKKFEERSYGFDLAKSGQFDVSEINEKTVKFKTGNEEFLGTFGGMDLLVKLDSTGKSIKSAFLKIALNVEKKLPYDGFEEVSRATMNHFSSAYQKDETTHSDKIISELKNARQIRAMSVDLGIRSFGACSVFQLACDNTLPDGKFALPAVLPDGNWVAIHERSFLTTLPGEDISDTVAESRHKAMDEVKTLQEEVRILSEILKIINQPNLEKKQNLIEAKKQGYTNEIYNAELESWSKIRDATEINIKATIFFKSYEKTLAEKIATFRRENKARQKRDYYGGKSMWMIDYLTELRRLLLRWSNHPRKAGSVIRQKRETYGTVCKKLLEHINNLKDDRIKTGADLLIQASRGFIYDKKTKSWIKKFAPCNVIVFEDLSRYSFNSGKTKLENNRLMKWAHRSILEKIKEQSALYGISIYDSTDARYTSKFYARTNAPGIRCKSLKKEDFTNDTLKRLKDCYSDDEIKKSKVGDLIPMDGGELFATIDKNRLKIIHADLNASWNLQRKFWGRHTDLLYFKTFLSGDRVLVKGNDEYKRFDGALKMNYPDHKENGLTKTDAGDYKITSNKSDTVEKLVDSEYPPYLFRDISGQVLEEQSEKFVERKKFEETVRSKIIKKIKEISFGT